MKNLGKIFVIFLLSWHTLFAGVKSSVDNHLVTLGEGVTYTLTLSGDKIEEPNIDQLCGEDILSTSSQTSVTILNGKYSKNYILSYRFMPTKNCTINPKKVVIDGKTHQTKKIKIKVVATKKDADFILNLSTKKKDLYVGEEFDLSLTFKQKIGSNAVDSKFETPKFKGFWLKSQSKVKRHKDGEFSVTKIIYHLAPQRVGKLSLGRVKLDVASRVNGRDVWGSFIPNIKWRSYFSNLLTLNIKPIPDGANLIGNFSIDAKVDKTKIEINQAVNLSIKIKGEGNLEDIDSFSPKIVGANIFNEKPIVKNGIFIQKMAIVSDSSFTIPSFKLKYYDKKTKTVKTIKTKEIKIEVLGVPKSKELVMKKAQEIKPDIKEKQVVVEKLVISKTYIILAFIVGLLLGVVLMSLKKGIRFEKKQTLNLKDTKLLMIKLLPFREDKEVQEIVDALERNLYGGDDTKVDKKLLKTIIKKYKIV